VVAFSDFDLQLLYGERERLLATLHQHYRLWRTVAGLGPLRGSVYFYLPPQLGEPEPDESLARFENGVILLPERTELEWDQRTNRLDMALYWHAPQPLPDQEYVFFVHLTDSAGALLVGWDNLPCRGTCPTRSWLPGEIVRDEYSLLLTSEARGQMEEGSLRLLAGLYDGVTGTPVYATGAGTRQGDHRVHVANLARLD
jgi:hypothetical protein